MVHRKRKRRIADKAGLPPGTIVPPAHLTDSARPGVLITQVIYDAAEYLEREIHGVEATFPAADEHRTVWINVDGVHEVTVLERFGRHFNLHPLLLEDIAHTGQRPKLENYGEHLFMDLNVYHLREGSDEIGTEQISLVLGGTWLLSFNEGPQPWVRLLRDRLKIDKAHCRKGGPDYLAYSRSSMRSSTITTKCSSASATASMISRRNSWPPRRRRRCTRSTPSSAK